MNETSKSRPLWGALELGILSGSGIDIGCGADPVLPGVRKFDIEHGDANEISRHVQEQFDFVYSSHCLEHMREPKRVLPEWWKLVKPGGHLFLIVPDEDLYEQGCFPSRFNPDHKATFTIAKEQSWSPVSINLRELVLSLPEAELVSLTLQDQGYDRRLLRERSGQPGWFGLLLYRIYRALNKRSGFKSDWVELQLSRLVPVDQTLGPKVMAQIQCIVKKRS